jgi:hypothetical protein
MPKVDDVAEWFKVSVRQPPPPAPQTQSGQSASSEQARRNDCDSWMAKRIELDEKQCKCDNVI